MDDARQRRVRRQRRDLELEGAGLVDRAGKHRVAHRLVDRDALAGDRRLVDAGAAPDRRRPSARARPAAPQHGAQRDLANRLRRPAAIGLAHRGFLRRHRQQALDRIAGAVDRARLDRLGDGVQRHHHRGFGPLADREGARDGHGHQRVDVQPPVAQRRQPFL
jgi:hypothetical protein